MSTENAVVPATTRLEWAEIACLIGLAFVLPIFEASKNLFWFLYLVLWCINRIRARDGGGPWHGWDTLICVFVVAPWIDGLFAGLHGGEWGGARDVGRYGLLLWAVSRTRYTARQWRAIVIALLLGTLTAGCAGAWFMFEDGRKELELHSVGHSNHSAIYLTVMFGAALSWTFAHWRSTGARERAFWIAGLVLLGIGVVLSGSRIAVAVTAVLTLLLGAWFGRRSWKPLAAVAGALAVSIAVIVQVQPWVLQKHLRNVSNDNVLAYRDLIWERAMVAWEEYPWFGVGMDNFNGIDSNRYRHWLEARGKAYSPTIDFHAPHGHSLYFNALAERGLVGLAVLLALLGGWFAAQWRGRPGPDQDLAWALWGASFSAWFTAIAVGTVNTTLHTEHALLSMLLLGAWLAARNRQPHDAHSG